jgi:lipoprotein-anchoring transpeptidase ErfK/SrfK
MARVLASFLAACAATATFAVAAPARAATPPPPVTGLAADPASGRVTLTWTTPEGVDAVVVRYAETTAPATHTEGTLGYEGTGTTATVSGLTNGTPYGFAVFTRSAGDHSGAVTVTTTPAKTPTVLQAAGLPVTVLYNRSTTLHGTLKDVETGAGLPGKPVQVWRRQYGETTYRKVWTVTTNASGVASYTTLGLLTNARWYLAFPGDAEHSGSLGANTPVSVAPRVAHALSSSVVEQNVPATVRVRVYPGHAGRSVALQVFRDRAWRHVAYRTLSSESTASFRIVSSTVGTRYFRVLMSAHADHTTGKTATFGVKVVARTLRQGMSGSDVLAVEKRLASLRYDVGAVDGYYDYDTTHAAMAFQKVQRMRVTGAVDATTRAKLSAPVKPRLRYSRSGAWVEADLTKQVLYYARDGVVVRILDISSGSGELFTVDGETQRATTPTGSFRIFHKIDGLRVSRLGELWRPAYFASGGYAIHGSGFVPAWPDSHGCIRITNPAMNRLFSMLTIGLPVYVYRS